MVKQLKMDNGNKDELLIEFLEQLTRPIKSNDSSHSARQFRYISALTDAMGEGTAAFYQLRYQFQQDSQGLMQALLAKPHLDIDKLYFAVTQWFANLSFTDLKVPDIKGPLSQSDIQHWQEQGYVVVKNIIDRDSSFEVADWVMHQTGMTLNDPTSWHKAIRGSIMKEIYVDPMLERARNSVKARQAFRQLWGADKLYCNRDRVSVNVPQTQKQLFSGPHLHLDVSFHLPTYFATQGIVYLNDVAEDQGALTLCHGFHKHFQEWQKSIQPGDNPNDTDFYQYPHKSIAADAGDLIIWNHWLPHGASPNNGNQPRIAQYLNMYSLEPCFV